MSRFGCPSFHVAYGEGELLIGGASCTPPKLPRVGVGCGDACRSRPHQAHREVARTCGLHQRISFRILQGQELDERIDHCCIACWVTSPAVADTLACCKCVAQLERPKTHHCFCHCRSTHVFPIGLRLEHFQYRATQCLASVLLSPFGKRPRLLINASGETTSRLAQRQARARRRHCGRGSIVACCSVRSG